MNGRAQWRIEEQRCLGLHVHKFLKMAAQAENLVKAASGFQPSLPGAQAIRVWKSWYNYNIFNRPHFGILSVVLVALM